MKDLALAVGVFVLAILAATSCFRPPLDQATQLVPTPTTVPVQAETVPPGTAVTPPRSTATPLETLPPPSPAASASPEPSPPAPTPEPACRHDKMESGLSALMYTRERIKESPPAPGSQIDRLLSRRDIQIGVTFNYRLTDIEIAELEDKGIIFDRLPNGTIAGQHFWTGNLAGKWDIGAVIPWDLVCWFSNQEYVFRLRTDLFPGMKLN